MAAQQPASPHARVELLAEQATVKPGSQVQLGVHFVLESGWHIYWINPGDSGQPPSFKWQLPPGFTADEIQWTRPERMQPIPQLADFGYHDEVLLPVMVHVPSSVKVGSSVPITADAKWLVCREVCIPEHSSLHLSLLVAATAKKDQQSASIFVRTRKLLPQPMPHGWKASAKSGKDDFVLSVMVGKRITKQNSFLWNQGRSIIPLRRKLSRWQPE